MRYCAIFLIVFVLIGGSFQPGESAVAFFRDEVSPVYEGEATFIDVLQRGAALPLSVAPADLDGDSYEDFACGYKYGVNGLLAVFFSQGLLWKANVTPSFVSLRARVIRIPEPPDFLLAGDFDGDGLQDLVAASLQRRNIYLLRGPNFKVELLFKMPSRLTYMSKIPSDAGQNLPTLLIRTTSRRGIQDWLLPVRGTNRVADGLFVRHSSADELLLSALPLANVFVPSRYTVAAAETELNKDDTPDLIVLRENQSSPILILSAGRWLRRKFLHVYTKGITLLMLRSLKQSQIGSGCRLGIKLAFGIRLEVTEVKKNRKKQAFCSLGDLVVELFEQARKVTSDRLEQNLMVYVALRDLLKRRNSLAHPIALRS
jgi:hypothetical protein